MKSKEITMSLSTKSVNATLKEIRAMQSELRTKAATLARRVASRLAEDASSGFSSAVVDVLLNGGPSAPSVSVEILGSGNTLLVVASGPDAIWVEFGTGVYYNGAAGSSPHPKGGALGYTIGGYGKGQGKRNVWAFDDGNGVQLTLGTPAAMPMYKAVLRVAPEIAKMAWEVFG